MSLTTTQSLFQYAIASLGQAFSPACEIQNASDFVVTYTAATTLIDTALTLNVDYTISGAATAGIILSPTVTLEAAGLHYATGGTLTIQRKNPFTQPTTYVDGVKYLAATDNSALNWLTYSIQALNDIALRSLRVPASNATFAEMSIAQRASKIQAYDSAGGLMWLPQTVNPQDITNSLVVSTNSLSSRTLADRFAEVLNVRDFGAVGNGIVDDTAAIQAAINKAVTLNAADGIPRVVWLPPGKYKVSATLVCGTTGTPCGSVAIIGAGMRQSVLVRSTDYGDTLKMVGNYSGGNDIQGLGFLATGTVTSGAHLVTQQLSGSVISDLWMLDGFVGLKLIGCYDIVYDRIRIWGGSNLTGTNVTGSYYLHIAPNAAPANPNFDVLFSNFLFRHSGTAKKTSMGIMLEHTDGVWFQNGHVIGANFAMNIVPPLTYTVQNIQCDNVFLDGNCQCHLQITGTGTVNGVRFVGCVFGGADGTANADAMAINCALLRGLSFRACEWGSNQAAALNLIAGAYIDVIGCKFADNNLASVSNVLTASSGCSRVNIRNCSFGYQPANVAIWVNGATNLTITGCDFQQCGSADLFTNSLGAKTQIKNNTTDRTFSITAAATLPVDPINTYYTVNGATGITALAVGAHLQIVTLGFTSNPVLTNGASLRLAGAANFNATQYDYITLQSDGVGGWIEVSRSVN